MAKWAKKEAHNHGFSELPHSISKSDEGEALKTLARIVGDVSQQTVLGPRRIHLAV